jgi:YVTN family beta-propeller protein
MNRFRFGRVPRAAALVVVLGLGFGSTAHAEPFAYVPNEGSGNLSIIDIATDSVVGEIPAGSKPRGTAVSPDGQLAWVSDQPGAQLLVIDLQKKTVQDRVPLGESPEGVGRSADGRWVAAAVEERDCVVFVDTATRKVVFSVKTKGHNPEHAVFTPDSRRVYVSAENGRSVDVIDVDRREVVGQVPVGQRPRGIGFSPDGRRAYVASELADEVSVIDTSAL